MKQKINKKAGINSLVMIILTIFFIVILYFVIRGVINALLGS